MKDFNKVRSRSIHSVLSKKPSQSVKIEEDYLNSEIEKLQVTCKYNRERKEY